MNGSSAFTTAAPTKGSALNLFYAQGGNITAGPEAAYGSYGSGVITVNKTAGTSVTFPSAITFATAAGGTGIVAINVTSGNATFGGTVTMNNNDIQNSGTGTVTFSGAVSLVYQAGGVTAGYLEVL